MPRTERTDEDLLWSGDPEAFDAFFGRHVHPLLGFFAHRTGDPQLAADLVAETFASALLARRRHPPGRKGAGAWLWTLATRQLETAQARGAADDAARRRLGMARIELSEADAVAIAGLRDPAELAPRFDVRAHVVEES